MISYNIRKENLGKLIAQTSLADFAARTGRSKSLLSDCVNGRKRIGERMARSIEDEAGLPPGYLDNAEGGVTLDVKPQRRIPLLTWEELAAGTWPSNPKETLLIDMSSASEKTHALSIRDDSMYPLFSPGDSIVVDPQVKPLPGDFVLAKTTTGFVFRKYRLRQDDFLLVPLNEDYPTISGKLAEVRGVMLEHRTYRRTRE